MSAATSLLTPATSSLTLISIGWLNPNFIPGNTFGQKLVNFFDQRVASQTGPPFVWRLEHGPDVGLVHAHHVVGDFGSTGLAINEPHLGYRLEQFFHLGRRRHGPFERGRRNTHGLEQQVAFIEPRHELAAEVEGNRNADAQ